MNSKECLQTGLAYQTPGHIPFNLERSSICAIYIDACIKWIKQPGFDDPEVEGLRLMQQLIFPPEQARQPGILQYGYFKKWRLT